MVKPIWILLKQELGYMQVCTSLQTDNHTSTPPLNFLPPNQQRQSTEGNTHHTQQITAEFMYKKLLCTEGEWSLEQPTC